MSYLNASWKVNLGASNAVAYLITRSARARNSRENAEPSLLAVFRLLLELFYTGTSKLAVARLPVHDWFSGPVGPFRLTGFKSSRPAHFFTTPFAI